MKNINLTLKDVWPAFISDHEMVLDISEIGKAFKWIIGEGVTIVSWSELVKNKNGEIVEMVSNQAGDEQNEELQEKIKKVHSTFIANPKNIGKILIFCFHLSKPIAHNASKISTVMRVAAGFLGGTSIIVSILLLMALASGVTWVSKEVPTFFLCVGFGVLMLFVSYKGHAPLFFGDPDWFYKAVFRYKVKKQNGSRKWKITNPL